MELVYRLRMIRVFLSVAKRSKCFSMKGTMNSVISVLAGCQQTLAKCKQNEVRIFQDC